MISLEKNGNVSKKGERIAEASRMVPGTPDGLHFNGTMQHLLP
jgi:hypothetical protein